MTLTATSLADRLRRASAGTPSDLLRGDDWNDAAEAALVRAAVLVPVVDRPEPGLLLTVRNAGLRHHAGQISFPGGRAEGGESAAETALREAREEIALDSRHVEVIGEGDPYRTITGFLVTPVLAIISADAPFAPDLVEVDELFEAPLEWVMDRRNHELRTVLWQGRERSYYEIHWSGRRIWGATAAMIVNLSRRGGSFA